ncbi:hypothetical protein A2U01_0084346 [Trifolium medium]|uniref:Uncharacterized protein n=1 Tax=Trifolium medium TaxID=97028 RepID=A0A392TPG7_9FABA|nr:hypothetical protein [Trifolium medium]
MLVSKDKRPARRMNRFWEKSTIEDAEEGQEHNWDVYCPTTGKRV